MASTRPRIQVVLDWDGTITTADTTTMIGSRCLQEARDLAQPDLPPEKLPKPMQYYSEQYMREYQQWKGRNRVPPRQRQTVEDEVSHLSESRCVEQASYLRVRQAALDVPGGLANIAHDERTRNELMMDAGRQAIRKGEVQIRDPNGLGKLITKAHEPGNTWGIVSVSWSRRFILGALVEAGLIKEDQQDEISTRIRCNELLAPHARGADGDLVTICTASDKQNALHLLLADWDNKQSTHLRQYPVSSCDDDATITIYIGDSSTDLGCLAGPSIGMLIGGTGSLDEPLDRLGIRTTNIEDLPSVHAPKDLIDMMETLRDEAKPPHIICRIDDFQQIYDWLLSMS